MDDISLSTPKKPYRSISTVNNCNEQCMWFREELAHITHRITREAPDYIDAHEIKHTHNSCFILFIV